MSYSEPGKIDLQLPDSEHIGRLLIEIKERVDEVIGIIPSPTSDDDSWPLEHGQVGVILVPSDPPTTACIEEHPDTGHWMLQYPCGGIYVADLTTGQSTF